MFAPVYLFLNGTMLDNLLSIVVKPITVYMGDEFRFRKTRYCDDNPGRYSTETITRTQQKLENARTNDPIFLT